MNLNEYAKAAHENAVKHGFWEQEQDILAYFALIHSEWSEALEEYRAGRPMVWHQCINWEVPRDKDDRCVEAGKQSVECIGRECCKPEGIAVELIDGVLRILDLAGRFNLSLDEAFKEATEDNEAVGDLAERISNSTLPTIIGYMHTLATGALDALSTYITHDHRAKEGVEYEFASIIHAAFTWVSKEGYDPWAVMEEKHVYNLTRPYKHGKVC